MRDAHRDWQIAEAGPHEPTLGVGTACEARRLSVRARATGRLVGCKVRAAAETGLKGTTGREMLVALLTASFAFRVAVFGGSGFIGSRICQTLATAGCEVVSISRAGQPPAWAADNSWSARVEWLSADMLANSLVVLPLGKLDAAISCVGNSRPSPIWQEFFGLHWDPRAMSYENGLVNERIVRASRDAGATRFVYISLWSTSKFAFGGPPGLAEYVEAKLAAENAARRVYGGDESVAFICPHLVYGGERFASLGSIMAAVLASPVITAYIESIKWCET